MADQYDKPTVIIMVEPGAAYSKAVEEIHYGLEEEKIPCRVETGGNVTAPTLAFQAAQMSRLGVGMGVTLKGDVAVSLTNLTVDKPYLTLSQNESGIPGNCRRMGKNAARLVKGTPLDI